jgi:very-short-patch-repair endonuclease
MTPAEARLWTMLQNSQLEGRKFRRQHSFYGYILDFYCPSERLAVELDGQPHNSDRAAERDRQPELFLKYFGIRVLRFENRQVFEFSEWVVETIRGSFRKKEESGPWIDD